MKKLSISILSIFLFACAEKHIETRGIQSTEPSDTKHKHSKLMQKDIIRCNVGLSNSSGNIKDMRVLIGELDSPVQVPFEDCKLFVTYRKNQNEIYFEIKDFSIDRKIIDKKLPLNPEKKTATYQCGESKSMSTVKFNCGEETK